MLSRRNKFIATILALFSFFFNFSTVALNAVDFEPPSQTVSLAEGAQAETFALESWVVKNGPNDYEMWYTHVKTDLDLFGIIDGLKPIISQQFLSDLANLNLPGLLDHFAEIASGEEFDALWNLVGESQTVIGYATSTNGVDWAVINDEVISLGSSFWNSTAGPRVIKNSSSEYELWYTHGETTLTKEQFQALLLDLADAGTRKAAIVSLLESTRSIISHTTSTDGENWTSSVQTDLSSDSGGIWDSVMAGSVIKSAGEYQMWFTHVFTDLTESDLDNILADPSSYGLDDLVTMLDGTSSNIGYATSSDGQSWNIVNISTLSVGSGVWNSVATPSVIRLDDDSYEMWFTRLDTNLTSDDLPTLFNILIDLEPDIIALWEAYNPDDLTAFLSALEDFLANKIDDIRSLFAATSTVIAYATSPDGQNWTVDEAPSVTGPVSSPWGSVGLPCVILDAGVYEMWYTRGTGILDAQFIVDLLQGTFPMLGYISSGPALVEVNLDLVSGWNFIGLPVDPTSTAIGDVLESIIDKVTIVWAFDNNAWSFFIPGLQSSTLEEMTAGSGYWVNLNAPASLNVSGMIIETSDIVLDTGWNLISLSSSPTSTAITDVLNDILENITIVWYFDSITDIWLYFIPGLGSSTLSEMIQCNAYWINMTVPGTLSIE